MDGPVHGRRHSVQSAEIGTDVLKALARLGASASLSQIADATGMAAAKVHRYMQALIAGGFAEQDAQTGRYALGPEALVVGLAAIGRLDVIRIADPILASLRERLGETCILVVWANRGATVVRVEESPRAVTLVVRIGSVLPLTRSASGLAFAAFLSAEDTAPILADEMAGLSVEDAAMIGPRLADIRARGVAAVNGLLMTGIDAVAAPVFDDRDRVACVLTALGPSAGFDTSAEGPIAKSVTEAAGAISRRLGHRYLTRT